MRSGHPACWSVGRITTVASLQTRNYVHLARPLPVPVRARRGDDVDAERCLRGGRDQALLWSMLGSHVVDFSFF